MQAEYDEETIVNIATQDMMDTMIPCTTVLPWFTIWKILKGYIFMKLGGLSLIVIYS